MTNQWVGLYSVGTKPWFTQGRFQSRRGGRSSEMILATARSKSLGRYPALGALTLLVDKELP